MGEGKRRLERARVSPPDHTLTPAEAVQRFHDLLGNRACVGFALHMKVLSTTAAGVHSEAYSFGLSPEEVATVLVNSLRTLDAEQSAAEDDDDGA